MITQETIKTLHNGLFHCPADRVTSLMPELLPIIEDFETLEKEHPFEDYTCDVKVHMLMPGQYPCIPGWHFDMVPRGPDGKQDFSRTIGDRMFLFVSGEPRTVFRIEGHEYPVSPMTWVGFTQADEHRGTVSHDFTWRLFIRMCPHTILQPEPDPHKWIRRHSQVYLNAEDFSW